jgi:translation initiation factor 2B subunit (eIF-2B alpha/beta/delta family)
MKYGEIEKNIPILRNSWSMYKEIAKKMDVDDSILFKTNKEAVSMANAIRLTHGHCINNTATIKAFAKRMQKENGKFIGYRVWRIA